MNIVSYLENRWSHWIGGAEKKLGAAGTLLQPLGEELAKLTESEAATVVTTAGTSLAQNLVKAQAGQMTGLEALHATGKDLEAQLPAIGINISTEALMGVVATVAAAQKQANATPAAAALATPPPSTDAPAVPEAASQDQAATSSTSAGT